MDNVFDSGFDDFEDMSSDLIQFAETQLKVTLPNSYKALLHVSNGGYLKKNAYPTNVQNNSGDGYVLVESIYGISRDLQETNSILITACMTNEWELPQHLVLLDGDGHTWIGLDYRTNRESPSIVFIDTETEQEITLSDNFQQFIDGLIEEP